jgi:hypothetical protein
MNEIAVGAGEGWKVTATRPEPRVALFDVRMSDYHEYFFAAEGEKSVSITMLDPSDASHLEPQTFSFAKPHDWRDDLGDEEALLQLWQAVGVRR